MVALSMLGLVIAFVGAVWLLVITFKTSVLWGLGSLFIPIVSLIFVAMHWDETKRPFLIQVVGVVLMVAGAMMAPGQPVVPQ
ncbi:MAG TPA: hypothetical protein PLF92_03755 [Arenimonas sp.]|nr:hypothetical protein [Arenimonas sp.]HPW32001.1 hypothetical protein [Arenimonas sp.]